MPISLPAPLEVPIQSIAPLQPPADPPTADDVVNATRYAENVLCSHVTDEEASAALEYQHLIISAKTTSAAPVAAVAPGWFRIAVDQFNARFDQIDTRFDQVDARFNAKFRRINTRLREQRAAIRAVNELVQELQYDMGEVRENLSRMERISAIALNRSQATGSVRRSQEVSFPDGTFPTRPPHNLPLIDQKATLETMNEAQLKIYHQNYCPQRAGVNGRLDSAVRRREVLIEIGCSFV